MSELGYRGRCDAWWWALVVWRRRYFRKTIELGGSKAYVQIRVWLIRARLGEREPATQELRNYLANRKTGGADDWSSTVICFLTGQMTESTFLKAVINQDKKKEVEQRCEAYFYAGSSRLIAGDKKIAVNYFKKCLATDKKSFAEYQSAAAELKFLNETK